MANHADSTAACNNQYASGATTIGESHTSSTPPNPGIVFAESLMPASRLNNDAIRSPPCPISGLPAQPDVPVVNYEGHRIGFCCKACKTPWDLMSDAQKRDLVTSVLPAQRQATRRRAYQRWSPRR